MNRKLLIVLDKTFFRVLFLLVALVSKLGIRRGVKGALPGIEDTRRILVIRPGGLGDGLMAIPLLKLLKKHVPRCRVTLMCQRKTRPAFDYVRFHDELVVIDEPGRFWGNIRLLASGRFEIVLDLEQFRRVTSILTFLTGARIRVGFDTNSRRLLYTHLISYPNEKHFESVNMVRQLEVFDIHSERDQAIDLGFPLPSGLVERARSILGSVSVDPDVDFVVSVFPGVLKPHHRWKMDGFAALVRKILEENERTVVLLMGAAGDRKEADEVLRFIGGNGRVKDLVGRTMFGESLALLKASKILVSCDGGAVYMGASMGCGTISLWGPGVMERFKPPGERHIGLRKMYPCIPCVNYARLGEFPPCPYDRKCLNDISAEEVYLSYKALKDRIQSEEGFGAQGKFPSTDSCFG